MTASDESLTVGFQYTQSAVYHQTKERTDAQEQAVSALDPTSTPHYGNHGQPYGTGYSALVRGGNPCPYCDDAHELCVAADGDEWCLVYGVVF